MLIVTRKTIAPVRKQLAYHDYLKFMDRYGKFQIDWPIPISQILEEMGSTIAAWALCQTQGHESELREFSNWCANLYLEEMQHSSSKKALYTAIQFQLGLASNTELELAEADARVAAFTMSLQHYDTAAWVAKASCGPSARKNIKTIIDYAYGTNKEKIIYDQFKIVIANIDQQYKGVV